MKTGASKRLFARARRSIPGGVNSPVRAFGAVGGVPRFLVRGKGAHVFDADGNAYVDYVGSWGPLILGHADPGVLRAVRAAASEGKDLTALPLEALQAFSPSIGPDVFDVLSLEGSLAARNHFGGTAPAQVRAAAARARRELAG